ncbi:MAG: nicotinate-nucleotide adenylyltransferase [Ignavibacteriales bacterium]
MIRLGVMGGTFDPIHYGHLLAADEVRTGFGLDRVLFIPSGHPPHKQGKKITDGLHRYTMAVLATVDHPQFSVSTIELDRPGLSYSVDTVSALKAGLPEDSELVFITGADAITEILSWKDAERLLSLCDFVAVTRPGYTMSGIDRLKEHLGSLAARVHVFPITGFAISSSDIRERVRTGRPIRYLVPAAVEEYIHKMGFYTQSE